MLIRPETFSDVAAIYRVVEAAFARPAEAALVDALRDAGDLTLSLVARDDDRIVGHVAFSKMQAPFPALGLGPIAVVPDRQRGGIGGQLIREGLALAAAEDWPGVFVLGDPNYYGRFGFEADMARGFQSPYAGPFLMARSLWAEDLPVRSGRIEYAPAFAALG
jgi:putative acetyltransferase